MPKSIKLLIVADHASNYIPKKYNNLGLSKKEIMTHKAYDPGIQDLAVKLSKKFDSQLVLGKYSRLLIDCNRDINDPTLISAISDRKLILWGSSFYAKLALLTLNLKVSKVIDSNPSFQGTTFTLLDNKELLVDHPKILKNFEPQNYCVMLCMSKSAAETLKKELSVMRPLKIQAHYFINP